MRRNKLAIIVPCYNEKEIINYTIAQLKLILDIMIDDNLISSESKIVFVDDGSKDNTRSIILDHCKDNKHIALIDLSKNYGQQSAMLAGLNAAKADMYITIDADLQDDPIKMIEMVNKYNEGYDIVLGIRETRDGDSFLKRNTSLLFYKFMNMIGINIRKNHSEFRLMSKDAVNRLKEYKEKTIFLRGIVQNMGFKTCEVAYDELERKAGKTKYSFSSLLELAWTAITSFSVFPLKMISFFGALTSGISVLVMIYAIMSHFEHHAIPGWTSIMMAIAFFSGIIIMSLGIIGEYLGKVLIEVKNRPLYEIDKTVNL